jgi:isovaleryl-CoA dehydrogenase
MDQTDKLRGALERTRAACKETIGPLAADVDREARFPRKQVESLGSAGLLGLTVSKEHGGMGLGFVAMAEVVEEVAASCASTGMVFVMHLSALATIAAKATRARAESVLKPAAAGRHLSTLAFSERGSGAHFYAPVSRPRKEKDGFVLSAEKSFVTSAGEADSYLVSSLKSDATTPLESDIFFVPKGTAGMRVGGRWEGLGLRGNGSAPMTLEGVRLPAADLLGGEGEGLDIMLRYAVPPFHIGISAVNLGIGRSALKAAVEHAGSRRYEHTGGTPLAAVTAVQYALAEASIELDTARALLHRTAELVDAGSPDALLPLLEIKVACTRAALETVSRAMKVCGGAAFAGRTPVERAFRDAQAGTIMAPTTDVLKEFIGKALLGLPLF